MADPSGCPRAVLFFSTHSAPLITPSKPAAVTAAAASSRPVGAVDARPRRCHPAEAVPMRPMRPLHSVRSPAVLPAPRRRGRRPGRYALQFEALEFRALLATPYDGPAAEASAEIRTVNKSRPPGWMACVTVQNQAHLAVTFGAAVVTDDRTSLAAPMTAWPPASPPPRPRQTSLASPLPRLHQPRHLPKLAPAAICWPPRSGTPASRPLHSPAPRAGGDGDHVARVAVYSSASFQGPFHGLRGPHLRFRTSFRHSFRTKVTLPHEGR